MSARKGASKPVSKVVVKGSTDLCLWAPETVGPCGRELLGVRCPAVAGVNTWSALPAPAPSDRAVKGAMTAS